MVPPRLSKKKEEIKIEPKKKENKEPVEQKEYKPGFISIPRNRKKLHYAKLTSPYGRRQAEVLISTSSEGNRISRAHKILHVNEHGTDPNKIWTINYLNKNNKITYYDVIYDYKEDESSLNSFVRRQNQTFILNDWNNITVVVNILRNNEIYKDFTVDFVIKEGENIYGDDKNILMEISQYKTSVSLWSIKYIMVHDNNDSEPGDINPIFNY
jgi:hypothetical protein